jgi:osmotically inducible lipoprotein OsmB
MTLAIAKHLRIVVLGLLVWANWNHMSELQQRAVTGGAIGASGGAIIGAFVGGPLVGVLIGSAGGAAVAALSK